MPSSSNTKMHKSNDVEAEATELTTARELVAKAKGDADRAAKAVLRAADPSVITYLVRRALVSIMHQDRRAKRHTMKNVSLVSSSANRAFVEAFGNIMDTWRLSSGIALGKASKADLQTEATREAAMRDGHSNNEKFYATILKGMGDNALVEDAYTQAELDAIRRKVYK